MQEGKFVGSLQQWSTSNATQPCPTDRFDCFALPKLGPSKATQQRGNATHAPGSIIQTLRRWSSLKGAKTSLAFVFFLSLSLWLWYLADWQLVVCATPYELRPLCGYVPMTPPLPKQRGTHWWYYSHKKYGRPNSKAARRREGPTVYMYYSRWDLGWETTGEVERGQGCDRPHIHPTVVHVDAVALVGCFRVSFTTSPHIADGGKF